MECLFANEFGKQCIKYVKYISHDDITCCGASDFQKNCRAD